jgi:hypothetical protein
MDETSKKEAKGAGESEWPGSDEGRDNITRLERRVIL